MLTTQQKQDRTVGEINGELAKIRDDRSSRAREVLRQAREWLRGAMSRQRRSQVEVAVLADKAPMTVRNILKANSNTKVLTLAEIADTLGFRLVLQFEPRPS